MLIEYLISISMSSLNSPLILVDTKLDLYFHFLQIIHDRFILYYITKIQIFHINRGTISSILSGLISFDARIRECRNTSRDYITRSGLLMVANTTQKTKTKSNTDPTNRWGWTHVLDKGKIWTIILLHKIIVLYGLYVTNKNSN
jgi:hypothetical protein